ncbi:MAG: hypothetical protein Q7J35_08705 [Candidatus Methanoperedens sp.]|nr:hypothetical protein [Candidatus Methanoperedens sp.]
MQKTTFKEVKLKLPSDMVETISSKEIVALLLDKALSKAEYYQSKCKEFEDKYNMDLASFKKQGEEAELEVFTEWDDIVVWEGYELAYKEWKRKYEGLKGCME